MDATTVVRDQDVVLSVSDINKAFITGGRTVDALSQISLDVKRREFVSLVGPSGCGKTTLLRIIGGLETADSGSMSLNNKPLNGFSRDIGFVFQDINLLPWRSVVGNVELGLEARKMPKQLRRERALEVLEMVGLSKVADAAPYTLSGGMQQRVGVARAIAVQPQLLLMDEPFGQLDAFTRERLQTELAELWERLDTTIVFVTHDVDEAVYLSDRIVLFDWDPGRISKVVPVDLPRPRDRDAVAASHITRDVRHEVLAHLHGPMGTQP